MNNIRKQLAACASIFAMISMAATAHAGSRPFMSRGETVAPPSGFASMCERGDDACGTSAPLMAANTVTTASTLSMSALATSSMGGAWATVLNTTAAAPDTGVAAQGAASAETAPAQRAAEPVMLGKGALKLLNTVNREVNRDVHKESDFNLYGLLEYWSLPRVIDGKMYGDCEDYALEKRRRLIAAGVPAQALSMAVVVTRRGEGHAVLVVSLEDGDVVLDNLSPWAMPWEDVNYHWVQRQVAGTNTWTTVS